jgi:flagella basal body P-ring formation protein FlgA
VRGPVLSLPTAVLCLLLAAAPSVRAQPWQPLDAIRAAAVAALGADPASADASVSPTLRLAACGQPLAAVATGARTAQVRCPDAPGWTVYVPVSVRREADVVVLREPVPAGEPIRPGQLVVQRRDLAGAGGQPIGDPALAAGLVPARPMAAGTPLMAADLSEGPVLRRGDPVVLVTRVGGVEVRVGGRALGSPGPGGLVRAENVESRRIVQGRVAGPGIVEVLQ